MIARATSFSPLVLLALLVGAPALAADSSDAALASDLAEEADLHFGLGIDAYRDGDYREALEHLLLSNRLAPNRNVVFNIARVYENLEEYDQAYRAYAQFEAAEPDPDKKKRGADAMNRLRPKVALVRIESEPAGAEVYVERKNLGARGVTPLVLAVPAGEQELIVSVAGYEDATTLVNGTIGVQVAADLTLERILAEVEITGEQPGAQVFVKDTGESLGVAPVKVSLAPEPTVLELKAPGYQTKEIIVQPVLGETRSLRYDLDSVTGQLEVTSNQRGARVELGDELLGYTPLLVDVPVGSQELVVRMDGFQTIRRTVEIDEGARTILGAPLIPEQETITGSGLSESLLDAPASIVVLSREEMDDRGYDNLAEVLQDLPGFDTMPVNGTTYQNSYQRGYRTPFTQRTLLIVDGRVDNHLWTHMANLSRQYPITMIERVEVLYGPASAVYGANAFLGIINVVTRKGAADRTDGEVRLGYGSFNSRVVDGTVTGSAGEDINYSASVRLYGSDEANLSGEWDYVQGSQLKDPEIWGAMADPDGGINSYGTNYADGYQDPTDDWGVHGSISIGDLELGGFAWSRNEGYGPYYATDAGHSAAQWQYTSKQLFARHAVDLDPRLTLQTEAGWRANTVYGDWAESFYYETDSDDDGVMDGDARSLSLTTWQSLSQAMSLETALTWEASDTFTLMGGARYEHKQLTKAYDIPGYGYSSVPLGEASYFFDPSTPTEDFVAGPEPGARMPSDNLQPTDDVGAFVQGIVDVDRLRFNGGLRVDHNSFYHDPLFTDSDSRDNCSWSEDPAVDNCDARRSIAVNPRLSAIYKVSEAGALKVLYGEAFQEPAPIQVWGGWNGRAANEALVPEKARNVEVVGIHRTAAVTTELSAYSAWYDNVIKEEAENSGERQVMGLEYRGSLNLDNPLPADAPLKLWGNASLTSSTSSVSYNHDTAEWVRQEASLGDIAGIKANLGATVPVHNHFLVSTRANYVGSREAYLRNALRAEDYTFDPYLTWHAHLQARFDNLRVGLRINNILDADYLVPGPESAGAGRDEGGASAGFHNSAVPTPGRSYFGTAELRF